MNFLNLVYDFFDGRYSRESIRIGVRGLISCGFACFAFMLLYAGCALQQQQDDGGFSQTYIFIIVGVLVQIASLALLVINQNLKNQENDGNRDAENNEGEEKRTDTAQKNIEICVLVNQAFLFILGLIYFLSGVCIIGNTEKSQIDNIWYVLIILGILTMLLISFEYIRVLHTYKQVSIEYITLISALIYQCIGFALIFWGVDLLYQSVQNNDFQYIWIFFIVVSYSAHLASFVILARIKINTYLFLSSLILGFIYLISGILLGTQDRVFGDVWLCVSIPGTLLIIGFLLVFLTSQPILQEIYTFTNFSCCDCFFKKEESKEYHKLGDGEAEPPSI